MLLTSTTDSLPQVAEALSSAIAQQIHHTTAVSTATSNSHSLQSQTSTRIISSQQKLEEQQKQTFLLDNGYVFTNADRKLFAHGVVQFCAQDLHNFDVVEVCKLRL